MAVVRCPSNVSSITLVTSGVQAPASGLITCTAAEATDLVQTVSKGAGTDGIVDTVLAGGATRLQLPKSITSITINGNVRVPDGNGVIAAIPAADASVFGNIQTYCMSLFQYVSA